MRLLSFRHKRQDEEPTAGEAVPTEAHQEPMALAGGETPDSEAAPEHEPAPQADPLASLTADIEPEPPEEEPSEEKPAAEDDPLDSGLLDIFRDAKNEVVDSTLASELEDVPIQKLLEELAGVSLRLGITPRLPTLEARADQKEEALTSPEEAVKDPEENPPGKAGSTQPPEMTDPRD